MLDSWSSTTSRQPVFVSTMGGFIGNSYRLQLGLGQGGFDGFKEFGERGEMMFHLADGVGVGGRGERGGVSRQRAALRLLGEEEELVSKGPRFIDRQAVTQGRPFSC